MDATGNEYVADQFNHTVRKVAPGGVVTTLAGLAGSAGSANGTGSGARFNGLSRVAVDGIGNVYLADEYNHTIQSLAGNAVQIQTSTDLANWTTASTLTNLTGTASFSDPAANTQPRFYRLRQL